MTGLLQARYNTSAAPAERPRRVLEPSERTAEVLFGLIMVLTFTGSLSVAEAGDNDIRAMLVGALGCNLAWGIIDAVLYLMSSLAEKSRNLAIFRAIRQASDAWKADDLIAEALPPVIASAFQPADFERIRQRLRSVSPPVRGRLNATDWQGALGVCLLVFLSTFPVALPFVIMQDPSSALRASNAIAIAMLFIAGVGYGRSVERSPWAVGLSMVLLGAVLVTLTMALGG